MSDDKFQHKYRIDSARAWWHNYDGGAYFITICTENRDHFFGEIKNGVMVLSEIGEYAFEQFDGVSKHYPYATIPLFTIMPNHIHAIVFIGDNMVSHCRDGARTVSQQQPTIEPFETVRAPSQNTQNNDSQMVGETVHAPSLQTNRWKHDNVDEEMQFISKQKGRLSVVIGGLKSAVTHFANQTPHYFAWQTRFHDHIIRDQPEMNRIATYIQNNVANWRDDEFYTPRK